MSENKHIQSILIIRLTSIGDVLLTAPLLRVLSKSFPEAKIDFLTSTQVEDILKFNPALNELHTVDRKSSLKQLRQYREETFGNKKYDLVIDLQKNMKSNILSKGLTKSILRFDKRRLYKLGLVYLKKRPVQYDLIPDLYIKTANSLGIEPDGEGVELWLESDVKSGEYSPPSTCENRSGIVIAPGAYHFTKRWPIEKFASLCDMISDSMPDMEISIVGGREDIEGAEYLERKSNVRNFCGKLSLSESAELIDRARLVITNDTAVMHIASARRVPVIALFGSTVREFGFTPYNSEHIIIEKDLPCRPCTHYGKSRCPKKHFDCMNSISASEVHEAVQKMLFK